MKKLCFQDRLVYFTLGIVTLIFAITISVIYFVAKNKVIDNAVSNEQTDLNRNTELLLSMLSNGIDTDTVKKIAILPWNDGSGNYMIIEEEDSINTLPEEILLTTSITHNEEKIILGEIISKKQLLLPMQQTFNFLMFFVIFTLVVLFLAIRYAIRRLSQPEVEKQARLDTELGIAKRIQNGMLPDKSRIGHITQKFGIGTLAIPAKEIGGDFYNYLTIDDNLLFIIADVSGKGIPAAIYMTIATQLYLSIASDNKSPKETAEKLNKMLCRDNPTAMFTTAIIGRMNMNTGHVELCNAGHNPPLLIGAEKQPVYLTVESNVPLGLIENYCYCQTETTLARGTHMMLYTDGVTEAEDKYLRQLGQNGLISAASGQEANNAQQAVDAIMEYLKKYMHGQEQNDDITILNIKFNA